jgi:hypothetical protein
MQGGGGGGIPGPAAKVGVAAVTTAQMNKVAAVLRMIILVRCVSTGKPLAHEGFRSLWYCFREFHGERLIL